MELKIFMLINRTNTTMGKTAAEKRASEIIQSITNIILDSGNTVSKPMVKEVGVFCVDEVITALTRQNPNYKRYTCWHPIDYLEQVKEAINNL